LKNEKIFNELRNGLRIALPDGRQGLNDNGEECDMRSIAEGVAEFVEKYDSSLDQSHRKMIEQIEKYNEKLFADPIPTTVDGQVIHVQLQRTNNIMEQFFRYLKRLLRKKAGNISVKISCPGSLSDTLEPDQKEMHLSVVA